MIKLNFRKIDKSPVENIYYYKEDETLLVELKSSLIYMCHDVPFDIIMDILKIIESGEDPISTIKKFNPIII
ncbi:MAG: hypothetical protein RSC71_06250 [Cetobacterium sp.]